MFSKVLIANRGAIACRIIRTLKRMGVASVAVYAEADADSLHVQQADEAYSLGGGNAADTYLNQDKLFAIAARGGAGAIHPGYGFLSENAGFVRRCNTEGVTFIGPAAEHIEAFALKHKARELAEAAGVPLIPGTGLIDNAESACRAADDIGYPVMLKSTAGGGGIGMKVCRGPDEMRSAFDSVVRLSENNFSDGGVFIEKYIERARHVEVQIFGDGRGTAVALGERDCSLQRRNQKVIEETPAPGLPDTVRRALHDTAVRLVASVEYAGAGTVEFIYDAEEQSFYFLEVNTRLQVEHGVTEQVYGVDLVEWMLEQAASSIDDLQVRASGLKPLGHAVQARVYAEDPAKDFRPAAGLLSRVDFPQADDLRIDTWVETGVEVSSYFDPMLAKVIAHADERDRAIKALERALGETVLYGIETNLGYVRQLLRSDAFIDGAVHTRYLDAFEYTADTFDVLAAGTMTTVQDLPGRSGYWDVGVPPSGPFDRYSFALGNHLLGNPEGAAGLEMTLNGPTLRFNADTQVVITGAAIEANLDGQRLENYRHIPVKAGQVLAFGRVTGYGARAYLLIRGGIDCPEYLGSKSTFTLGRFGGHAGRALRTGDVLHFSPLPPIEVREAPGTIRPVMQKQWTLRVIYGPHGAPDFFTDDDVDMLFDASWEVHYNSSRTGIRLIGPKPRWARSDGGEAGLHPSNIHDNAYAFGTVDFTGDMPVILGPDGPSLGGFVCPVTVVDADLWKLGQVKAGDQIRFESVTHQDALALATAARRQLDSFVPHRIDIQGCRPETCVIARFTDGDGVEWTIRPAGDRFMLIELGENKLDLSLRLRVHLLMQWLQQQAFQGVQELTPGIRSLQVHYDPFVVSRGELIDRLRAAAASLEDVGHMEVPSRIVYLPLSWNDEACRLAVEKYMQSVRRNAPWCPDNIEFIRRINGLDSVDEVKRIVFEASYVVMGLGDVYLSAPVAVPVDPRHRLVTTKYNPARTWTAENSVGIGGSYLCVYGMEGPGGYQFVGRTLQIWNRHRRTDAFHEPWFLRFFDQIRFYEVSADELLRIREDFPRGQYPLKIEQTTFKLSDYRGFVRDNADSIQQFVERRRTAFAEELEQWRCDGQLTFEPDVPEATDTEEQVLPEGCVAVESVSAGNVWKVAVAEGDSVKAGQTVAVLESMKMEIEVTSPVTGTVQQIVRPEGASVGTGQTLLILGNVS